MVTVVSSGHVCLQQAQLWTGGNYRDLEANLLWAIGSWFRKVHCFMLQELAEFNTGCGFAGMRAIYERGRAFIWYFKYPI